MEKIIYKGYVGEYELYNDGNNSQSYYAGSIPSVSKYSKVLFEGETLEELTADFHAAVEDCIAMGYGQKEKKHRVSIPASLYTILSVKAKQSGESVSSYINHALSALVL